MSNMKASVFSNKLKTALIVALITALLYLVVYFIAYAMGWGEYAIVIAGVISIMSSVFSYWNSDKMVIKMSGAHEATGDDLRILQSTVAPLADRAGVPMPKLYVVEDSSPNAFATGRNPSHSAIAATRGLLNMMTPDELSGVLAHEMGHIKNYDILLQTVASVMIGAVIIISDMFSRSLWWGGARRRRDSDSDSGSGILADFRADIYYHRADSGPAFEDGVIKKQGIPGGRDIRLAHGKPEGASLRSFEARRKLTACEKREQCDRGHVYFGPDEKEKRFFKPLFHASADRKANRSAL